MCTSAVFDNFLLASIPAVSDEVAVLLVTLGHELGPSNRVVDSVGAQDANSSGFSISSVLAGRDL